MKLLKRIAILLSLGVGAGGLATSNPLGMDIETVEKEEADQ